MECGRCWLGCRSCLKTESAGKLVTVEDVANEHWRQFGRNYYARYDYEGVDKPKAEEMMNLMAEKAESFTGQSIQGMTIKLMDMFQYVDPVDESVSKNQGIRIMFDNGSRIIFRLSGTGVEGATVRLYLEAYESPDGNLSQHQFEVVKPLVSIAMEVSELPSFTGRTEPTVIT